ncbi:MAG: aminotransferase class V-fold PLP-dependent enzyme [Thermomicrobiales bacterium]
MLTYAADTRSNAEALRALFAPAPGTIYLDAATYGLPPQPTVDALSRALDRWQSGEANWIEDWDREGEACRGFFATLIGAEAADVALVPTASVGIGLMVLALPPGSEVVVPDDEFTSVMYPLLVAADRRGVTLKRVPFADLPNAVSSSTHTVAFSLTRSQDGATASLADMVTVARRHGARLLIDATHAVPFVPIAPWSEEIDALVCHGYKHLLCPRGVGFLYVKQDRWPGLAPWFANWRTGNPLYGTSYGGTIADLASDARRFDVSLAWHAWAGARQSLELLVKWQANGALEDVTVLARRLAAGLGLPEPGASIVSLRVRDAEAAESVLGARGIRCAARGGNIRLSPHVYNTDADIDGALEALAGLSV